MKWLFPFLTCSLLLSFVFKNIIFNPTTHLLDPYDYPYYAWILDHVISFIAGENNSLSSTPIFFPLENTYFFSDLLIPQALLGLIPYLLGANQIAVTNSIVIGTMLLNTMAAIFLWQKYFKNPWILTFTSLTTALSPFLMLQRGHLQVLTIWPFLLILGLLANSKKTYKSAIIVGLLWTVQLLASAYLAIFLIVVIAWLALLELIKNDHKTKSFFFYFLMAITVLVTALAPLSRYRQVRNELNIEIRYGEYIDYSAHLTDYLFTSYPTLGQQITQKWQILNHHVSGESATYPGISLIILSILGIFSFKKKKDLLEIKLSLKTDRVFFLGLLLIGLVFSLGPRLFVNGAYTQLPSPYAILLKLIPFFEAIRATSRWSWLFYISLVFFSGIFLSKIKNETHKKIIVVIASILFVIEIIPITSKAEKIESFFDQSYPLLQQCTQQKTAIILPFSSRESGSNARVGLERKTSHLLQTSKHNCVLVNGYGGFEPPAYQQLERETIDLFEQSNLEQLWQILANKKIELVLIESDSLTASEKEYVDTYFANLNEEETVLFNLINKEQGSWYLIELNQLQ